MQSASIPDGRGDGLGQTEVGVLEERELELVVLANRDERPGCVKAICKQEEGEEVDECVRELLVLLERQPDLLPADGEVILALGKLWARAGVLEDEPPDTGQYPISVCPDKLLASMHAFGECDTYNIRT